MRLPLAFLLVALLAGCGATAEEAGDSGSLPAEETRLEVTVWLHGRDAGGPSEGTLTCDPPGGTLPDPDGACALLEEHPRALDAPSGDLGCTEIYGGPQEARIVGTLRGAPVDATLSRTNGCEIDRWERAAPLLRVDPQSG